MVPRGGARIAETGRRSRLGAVVLVVATGFGVLFGVTAPGVSPVAPVPPAAVAQNSPAP